MCTCPGTKVVYYNMCNNISIIFRYGVETQKLLIVKTILQSIFAMLYMLKIICYNSYEKQETLK